MSWWPISDTRKTGLCPQANLARTKTRDGNDIETDVIVRWRSHQHPSPFPLVWSRTPVDQGLPRTH